MAKRNRKRKTPSPQIDTVKPTPEREARNQTVSAGMARRIKPMIDILRDRGVLSASQHEMLDYYREQANLAEVSPVRSCCDDTVRGGSGNGPGAAITSAKLEVARMERQLAEYSPGDAQAMADVLRAVARDDMSLSAYCIAKYGGRERYDARGRFVAMVPNKEKRNMGIERINLLYAARVITR